VGIKTVGKVRAAGEGFKHVSEAAHKEAPVGTWTQL